ncbi:MAG: hydroxylamine oxidoreductase, partial [Ignavibacteriales bacterium]|nr:hydroxylamine oxidoreductase [Ignavibacteriales bacterium]
MQTKDSNFVKYFIGALSLIIFISLTIVGYVEVKASKEEIHPYISAVNKKCIDCHIKKGIGEGQVNDWKQSRHAEQGIGCIECHKADGKDPDAYKHEGFIVATIVSPKDCSKCHEDEAKEFQASYHAQAAKFIGSLDNVLGNIIEGPAAANAGCRQCHGSEVRVMAGG